MIRFPGRRKLAALALAVPTLVAGTMAANVTAASAWHPEVTGKADCRGVVSFTATSWAQGVDGHNTKIGVYFSTDEGKTFKPVTDDSGATITSKSGVKYEFTAANKNTFSDNLQLADNRPAKVTLKVTSLGDWGGSYGTEVQSRTAVVAVPAPCAEPSAKIAGPDCKTTDAIVTMKNTGGSSIEFRLIKDTAAAEKIVVAANETKTLKVAVPKSTKISVQANGMSNVDATVIPASDCVKPSATVAQVCKADGLGFTTTLKNDGKVTQEFVIKSGTKQLDKVTIEAGKSVVKSYTFASLGTKKGESVKVDVLSGDKNVASETVKNDCLDASATIAKAKCDIKSGSGALITLTNKGRVSETFTVTRDGKAVEGSPVKVEAGKTTEKLLVMGEDETATILVTSASGTKVEQKVTVNCIEAPAPTIVTTVAPTTVPAAEVLPQVIERPALAETGLTVLPQLLAGLMLLGTGGGLLGARNRRQK